MQCYTSFVKMPDLIRAAMVGRFTNVKQLAIACDIPYTTVYQWVTGANEMSAAGMSAIARALEVDIRYFTDGLPLDEAREAFRSRSQVVEVPPYTTRKLPYWRVPATFGAGRIAEAPPDGYIEVPSFVKADYALQLTGDCLEPELRPGDIVGVQQQPICDPGQVALIEVLETGERTVKRCRVRNGVMRFEPDNGQDGYDAREVRVLGVIACLVYRRM